MGQNTLKEERVTKCGIVNLPSPSPRGALLNGSGLLKHGAAPRSGAPSLFLDFALPTQPRTLLRTLY